MELGQLCSGIAVAQLFLDGFGIPGTGNARAEFGYFAVTVEIVGNCFVVAADEVRIFIQFYHCLRADLRYGIVAAAYFFAEIGVRLGNNLGFVLYGISSAHAVFTRAKEERARVPCFGHIVNEIFTFRFALSKKSVKRTRIFFGHYTLVVIKEIAVIRSVRIAVIFAVEKSRFYGICVVFFFKFCYRSIGYGSESRIVDKFDKLVVRIAVNVRAYSCVGGQF